MVFKAADGTIDRVVKAPPPGCSLTIGRGQGCDVVFVEPFFSRKHALLRVDADGSTWLVPLASDKSLIKHNDRSTVTPVRLREGDTIALLKDIPLAQATVQQQPPQTLLDAARAEADSLRSAVVRLEAELAEESEFGDELEKRLAAMTAETDALRPKLAQLVKELADKTAELAEITQLRSEADYARRMEQSTLQTEEQIDDLSRRLQAAEDEREQAVLGVYRQFHDANEEKIVALKLLDEANATLEEAEAEHARRMEQAKRKNEVRIEVMWERLDLAEHAMQQAVRAAQQQTEYDIEAAEADHKKRMEQAALEVEEQVEAAWQELDLLDSDSGVELSGNDDVAEDEARSSLTSSPASFSSVFRIFGGQWAGGRTDKRCGERVTARQASPQGDKRRKQLSGQQAAGPVHI